MAKSKLNEIITLSDSSDMDEENEYSKIARFPITLLCGHTFCRKCVKLVEKNAIDKKLNCPYCRVDTILKYKNLKKNYDYLELLERQNLLDKNSQEVNSDEEASSSLNRNMSNLVGRSILTSSTPRAVRLRRASNIYDRNRSTPVPSYIPNLISQDNLHMDRINSLMRRFRPSNNAFFQNPFPMLSASTRDLTRPLARPLQNLAYTLNTIGIPNNLPYRPYNVNNFQSSSSNVPYNSRIFSADSDQNSFSVLGSYNNNNFLPPYNPAQYPNTPFSNYLHPQHNTYSQPQTYNNRVSYPQQNNSSHTNSQSIPTIFNDFALNNQMPQQQFSNNASLDNLSNLQLSNFGSIDINFYIQSGSIPQGSSSSSTPINLSSSINTTRSQNFPTTSQQNATSTYLPQRNPLPNENINQYFDLFEVTSNSSSNLLYSNNINLPQRQFTNNLLQNNNNNSFLPSCSNTIQQPQVNNAQNFQINLIEQDLFSLSSFNSSNSSAISSTNSSNSSSTTNSRSSSSDSTSVNESQETNLQQQRMLNFLNFNTHNRNNTIITIEDE